MTFTPDGRQVDFMYLLTAFLLGRHSSLLEHSASFRAGKGNTITAKNCK